MWSLNFYQVLEQVNLIYLDVGNGDSLNYKSLNCSRTPSISYEKKRLYEASKAIHER